MQKKLILSWEEEKNVEFILRYFLWLKKWHDKMTMETMPKDMVKVTFGVHMLYRYLIFVF